MNLYLAVGDTKKYIHLFKEQNVPNVLISYAYYQDVAKIKHIFSEYNLEKDENEFWLPKNIIIDSGAFSVWTHNEYIDIDKYADFCISVKNSIEDKTSLNFVNLDVLPGQFGRIPTEQERKDSVQKGWDNMLYLESKGIKVIPVFHQYEDFSWLEKMKAHTDYIGLSPANDASMKSKIEWLKKCFSITRDEIKCHGFAVTAYSQLIQFPFYSVDSSSWSAGGRFARIPILVDGKIKTMQFKNKNDVMKYWNDIKLDKKDIFEKKYEDRFSLGIYAFLELNKFITELWTKRKIIWK